MCFVHTMLVEVSFFVLTPSLWLSIESWKVVRVICHDSQRHRSGANTGTFTDVTKNRVRRTRALSTLRH